MVNISELANSLRTLIAASEDGNHDEGIRAVCAAIKAAGAKVEITTNDDSADALNGGESPLWVVSEHELTVDDEEPVASWTRCAMGDYGEAGRQCSDDEWCVSEDTNGNDTLPEAVATALDAFGMEDELPDVPAPDLATETHETAEDGEYAVYWETVGDDDHVVARYETLEAATAVCEQKNREFSARNPSGGGTTYLCGFGVRTLDGDKWVRSEDE